MLVPSPMIEKPTRSSSAARYWRMIGKLLCLFVTLAICVAIAMPVVLAILFAQQYAPNDSLRDERLCLIPFLAAIIFVPPYVTPWIAYSFGSRSRSRRFGKRVVPENIEFLQRRLRWWISILVAAQAICLAIVYWDLHDVDGTLARMRDIHWLFLTPLVIGLVGYACTRFGMRVFLNTRGRKQGVWKVNKRRGVPLRDFIWKWDTTARPIFERCRISRRTAGAYAATVMSAAGCYAAMGCLMIALAPDYRLAVGVAVPSMIATAWVWPMPRRLVRWTARTLNRAP